MKLTILGEYGPFAPAGGACSSYLLQGKHGGNILLDLGNGGLAQMQKYLSISQIDAVVLTHLHFDHISDLQILGYALSQLKLPRKPALYLPKRRKRWRSYMRCLSLMFIRFKTIWKFRLQR